MGDIQPLITLTRRILWLLAIAVLAGCAAASPRPTESKGTPAANNRYILYTRSGGIAGKTSTWTIYKDGRVQSDYALTYQATPQEAAALFDQIPLAAFIQQSKAPQPQACPDCITTTLEYHDGEQIYEVNLVLENANAADPARVWVDKIDAFLAKASSK